MKHPERVEDYLNHIVEAIDNILNYIRQTPDLDSFGKNGMVRDAIIRNFEIIGEAAKQLQDFDENFSTQYPELPWSAMRGMRNRLIHGYSQVNMKTVWNTIKNDLSNVRSQVVQVLDRLENNS